MGSRNPEPQARKQGPWVLTLDMPSYLPVQQHAKVLPRSYFTERTYLLVLESQLPHKIVNLNILISNSERYVDNSVGELIFQNKLVDTCAINSVPVCSGAPTRRARALSDRKLTNLCQLVYRLTGCKLVYRLTMNPSDARRAGGAGAGSHRMS